MMRIIIALIVPDMSNFMAWVPVIFGTPTIGYIVNVMKETEIDTLVIPCLGQCLCSLSSGSLMSNCHPTQ